MAIFPAIIVCATADIMPEFKLTEFTERTYYIISGLFHLSNERRFNVIYHNSSNRINVSVCEPWFDDDCYQAEKSAFEILSSFREGKCALDAFNNARKNYYDLCKLKRTIYANNKRNQLCRDAETGSPRFCENLNSQTVSGCSISNEEWFNFASELYKYNALTCKLTHYYLTILLTLRTGATNLSHKRNSYLR